MVSTGVLGKGFERRASFLAFLDLVSWSLGPAGGAGTKG
jgi:hypothetical protein